MLLTPENIAHYLLEKGLVRLENIVRGEFSVRDQSSRNANFAVNREYPPAYLVKQVRAHDQEKRETLRIEATCYWLANNDENYQALGAFLPGYHEYDYLNHVLILELLPDVENLFAFYSRAGTFPVQIAEKLADLMASYHTYADENLAAQPSFRLFRKNKPWVFSLADQPMTEWLKNPGLRNAEKQMIQLILANKEFMEHLRKAREDWSTASLTHGDIKFPNFLIPRDYFPGADPNIRLIDWELADIGDPLWDVAAIFQNYLSLWVSSDNAASQNHPATVALPMVQPSIAAFWRRYAALNQWTPEQARPYLEKALRYTALKLVHTCFEMAQAVEDLPPYGAKTLQLSLNLLRRPEEAIGEVLGIKNLQPYEKTFVAH